MSDFQIAHNDVMHNEGGYANNPNDRGRETYKGIARNFWPSWGGWKYIDGVKAQMVKQPVFGTHEYFNWAKYLNDKLAEINMLQHLVVDFYRFIFWKRLGEINDQALATWVYDKDINTGDNGSRWLQEAAHVKADGVIGDITLAAVNKADPIVLLERIKTLAVDHYLHEAQKPHQAGFWKSWITRVGLSPAKLAQANSRAHDLGIIV